MATKTVVLPVRPVGSDTVETFGLNLTVKEIKSTYRDVAKVVVEGTDAEFGKIPEAQKAFNAAEVADYEAAQIERAKQKAAGKAGG